MTAHTRLFVFYWLFFSCSLLHAEAGPAPTTDLRFRHYSVDDGLSHSKVNFSYQDEQGYLWFGTNEGLNRFDGYHFTAYRYEPHGLNTLSANLVRAIVEDTLGQLWIGAEAGGISVYSRNTDSFCRFMDDSTSRLRQSHHDVNALWFDSRHVLWVGTGNGLDRIQGDSIRHFQPYPAQSRSDIRNAISVLTEDRQQHLWVGTLNAGLLLFDRDTMSFSKEQEIITQQAGLAHEGIRSIHEDRQGNLWIGTNEHGLGLYDRPNKSFRFFQPAPNDPDSKAIRAILDDGQGNLWVGNRAGLFIFDRSRHTFRSFRHNPNDASSLSHNSVQHILQDRGGNLWIGTRDGINYLNMNQQAFIRYRADVGNPRCLNNKVVFAIRQDLKGNFWVGTEEGGLNYFNRKSGLFSYYKHKPGDPHSLNVNNLKALIEESNGDLWIGAYQGGLNYFHRHSGRFEHFLHNPEDTTSLAHNTVTSLCHDRNGNLWIGMEGLGVDRLDQRSRRFVHVLPGQDNILFQTVFVDRYDNLWTNLGAGLVGCLNIQAKQWKTFSVHPSRTVDLAFNVIFRSREDMIWIGTAGRGLYKLDPVTAAVQVFDRSRGLPAEVIYGILEDSQGRLWVSTTNGLCRLHPGSGEVKNYTKENGLQNNQFSYNAFFQTPDGELWFGGINGLTAFYPDQVRENRNIPPVVLTDFRLYNKKVQAGDPDGILQKPIDQTKEIILSWRQSSFSFEFAALDFQVSSQNAYQYKLEGFDSDWNPVDVRRTATYTNLNPGAYTFRVIAANNDGIWNRQGTSVRLTILPPFWQRWWFKGLLILALIFTVFHFATYYKQKRNLLQTTALAHLSQLKLLRYQMNPHFLFNTLNSIRSMILLDRDRAWQMVTELSDFFRYALLNFNRIEGSLDDEINAVESYLHIEKIRHRDTLSVEFQIDEAAKSCQVPAFLVQPLIENAIKYGMKTSAMPVRVLVQISFDQHQLSIDVSNTGTLLKPETGNEKAHGSSINNIRERLDIMFRQRGSVQLYEEEGWVHARIRITYPASTRPSATITNSSTS